MTIVRLSIKYIHAVYVLALLMVVLGSLAVLTIPIDILPAFNSPAVQVMTYYSGMPTSSIEKTITNRIERWTNQATGVRDGRIVIDAGCQRGAFAVPRGY